MTGICKDLQIVVMQLYWTFKHSWFSTISIYLPYTNCKSFIRWHCSVKYCVFIVIGEYHWYPKDHKIYFATIRSTERILNDPSADEIHHIASSLIWWTQILIFFLDSKNVFFQILQFHVALIYYFNSKCKIFTKSPCWTSVRCSGPCRYNLRDL